MTDMIYAELAETKRQAEFWKNMALQLKSEMIMRGKFIAELEAQIETLRRGQYVLVEDGQYRDDANVWQVWQGMVGVKPAHTKGNIYAGKLPDGWQLVRLAAQEQEGDDA